MVNFLPPIEPAGGEEGEIAREIVGKEKEEEEEEEGIESNGRRSSMYSSSYSSYSSSAGSILKWPRRDIPPRFFACIILHFPKCFLFYCNMEKMLVTFPLPRFPCNSQSRERERERESNDFRRGSKLLPSVDGKNKPKLFLPPFPK